MPDQTQVSQSTSFCRSKAGGARFAACLVMYAGAVSVPLILGGVLKLPKDQVALLISADLFACGLVTLIQTVGIWQVGIRLPVMMGVTFAAVGPMIAMASTPGFGLLNIYGAVIAAGIFGTIVAPLVSRMLPVFPACGDRYRDHRHRHHLDACRRQLGGRAPVPTMPGYGDPFRLIVALDRSRLDPGDRRNMCAASSATSPCCSGSSSASSSPWLSAR